MVVVSHNSQILKKYHILAEACYCSVLDPLLFVRILDPFIDIKILCKTLVLRVLNYLSSLKTDVNIPTVRKKQKTKKLSKKLYLVAVRGQSARH